MKKPALHLVFFLAFTISGICQEGLFQIEEIVIGDSTVDLSYPAKEGYYYVLYRGEQVEQISEAIDMALAPTTRLSDQNSGAQPVVFYRVEQIAVTDSRDSDTDGIRDADELSYPGILNPLDPTDAERDFDNDGKTNRQELNGLFGATDPGDAVFESVTFKTSDEFTIAASLGIPDVATESMPAVIFIHQGGSNRGEWEEIAKDAFRKSWVTLAYDIRGHGESSGTWTSAWYNDPDNAPNDLKAAIAYLKDRRKVDGDRIAVVGASVGGNLACVASALYDVRTAVAISHKTSAVSNLAGQGSLEFRSIFHLSSEGDQSGQRAAWATELYEQTDEPRKLEITGGSGHGVGIFETDATVPVRILEWLQETL